jgi:hypothetical protein
LPQSTDGIRVGNVCPDLQEIGIIRAYFNS